jgi:hypothetical protein
MLIAGFAIAIPITLLIRGGGGDSAGPATRTAPPLGPPVRDRGLAVRYRVPKGWKESRQASAIRLLSGDRTAQLVIAAPASAAASEEVLDDALAAIRSGYEDVEIASGSGRKVGGLRAKGAVISARNRRGARLRILVAVARGKKRTHLVELFLAASDSGPQRVRQAQFAVDSLRFTD